MFSTVQWVPLPERHQVRFGVSVWALLTARSVNQIPEDMGPSSLL